MTEDIEVNTKPVKNKRRKLKMILWIIGAVITTLVLVGTILHTTYFQAKKDQIQPYGQMLDIYDGQMHLYKIGNGDQTVVLLPGLGVALPCANFGPLMRSLSEKYTVVCVEYFGTGFSTQTSRERTCENYVEEIRAVLSAANIEAPYILMPHSISSVYSEYYASKYSDEVKAIISLDGTSTAYIGKDMPKFVKSLLTVAKVQQGIGLTSVLAPIMVNKSDLLSYGYSEKEISDLITFAGFSINENVLSQMRNSAEYIKEVNEIPFPSSVPYFKIISKQTYETRNSQIKISPEEYQQEHLLRVGAEEHYEILAGTHFIYLKNAERIRSITDEFLAIVK
jgi:pimeloyl-ACP methyl ester carboxylesterase